MNQGVVDNEAFLKQFKSRLRDTAQQDWRSRIENSSRSLFYRNISVNLKFKEYINTIEVKSHRQALCRLIVSSHPLRIESGRWDRTEIQNRTCHMCPSKLEDEYHFVLVCPLYSNLRRDFIKRFYWSRPSMDKFVKLITDESKKQIKGLAKYVYLAFQERARDISSKS